MREITVKYVLDDKAEEKLMELHEIQKNYKAKDVLPFENFSMEESFEFAMTTDWSTDFFEKAEFWKRFFTRK